MKLIYVASPYAGDIERNTEFAREACQFVMNEGHAFFVPHLLYPQVLDEDDPADRQLGLAMGKEMLPNATSCGRSEISSRPVWQAKLSLRSSAASPCGISKRRKWRIQRGRLRKGIPSAPCGYKPC